MSLPAPLLQLLPPHLHPLCSAQAYPSGASLFLSGSPPQWMFFVSAGEVVLERHGLNGETACLQRCQKGWVGEASLMSSRYHCDARVTHDVQTTRLPVQALRQALGQDGAFAQRWIAMLSQELRQLRLQNERLSLPKVQDRILHLIDTEGRSGTYQLTCPLKQLATQLAVTHEALYRALAQLEKAQRIERGDGVLRLLG